MYAALQVLISAAALTASAASEGIGPLLAEDLITVPASEPWRCELRVARCSNEYLRSRFEQWVNVPEASSSQYDCHTERQRLERECGSDAKVVLRYNGPWAAGPVRPDGSWLIQSAGVSGQINLVALMPAPLREDHRCFLAKEMTLEAAESFSDFESAKAIKEVAFCLPAIDIVGYPKCGTSAAYELLVLHNETLPAAKRKEMCIVGWEGGVWEWIEQLVPMSLIETDKLLVNGCFTPVHVFNQEILFRLYERPNVKIYVVRDLAERLWSAWNFWCDPKREEHCEKAMWTKIGVHQRSPEYLQQLLLDCNAKGYECFRNAPAPDDMAHYYLERYLPMNELTKYNITVYAKERLETDPVSVWKKISAAIREVYGRELSPHTSLHIFSEVLVNTNDHKGTGSETPIAKTVAGTYEISGHRPLLEESRRYIMENWKECSFWADLADWPYPCVA